MTKMEEIEYEEDELYEEEAEEEEEDQEGGYRPNHPLPAAKTEVYTTTQLHDLIHEGLIDLNPAWQRDIVWSDAKQSHLIDSLLHNIYIPPIVFAIQREEDGVDVRVCVDGKQRLTSIQKFIDGQISCRDPRTNKPYWYMSSAATKSRVEMSDRWKREFANKMIPCVEYDGLENCQIRDIFQRVQLGIPLRPAERLQALATPCAEWIGQLVDKYIRVDEGMANHIEFATGHASDFYNIAMAVFCCERLEDQPTPMAGTVGRWISRDTPPSAQFRLEIEHMIAKLIYLASDKAYNKVFRSIKQRVAPVEFVFICVTIFQLIQLDAEDEDIAGAIYTLRKGMRDSGIELRMNTANVYQIWPFVDSLSNNFHAPFVPVKHVVRRGRPGKRKTKDDDGDYRQPTNKRRR